MRTIGVCGRKGGSGKTTTTIHLAAELATRGGQVLVIDCDPQGSATHWSQPGALPVSVTSMPVTRRQDVSALAIAVRGLAGTHDYVVLDSPPHLDAALGAVIGVSDVAVIPCGPSGLDLLATRETVEIVREIRAARGDGKPAVCLVPNRVDLRTASGRQLEGALRDIGEAVAPAIHARIALADSFNLGSWVGEYAPQSEAHQEVVALTNYILEFGFGKAKGKGRA